MFLSIILHFSFEESLQPEGADEVIASLETLILLLTYSEQKQPKHLKLALKCAVRLCEVKSDFCDIFVDLLGSRLDNVDGKIFKFRFSLLHLLLF